MQIAHLSDDAVLSQLDGFASNSRAALVGLLVHLGEVQERRIHLQLAYRSPNELCMERFGMSEGEAFRRVAAARLARRYPTILDRLQRGEVSLSTVVLLRHYLTPENHRELLDDVARKSTKAVEKYLAARFPRPDAPTAIQEKLAVIEPTSAARFRVQFSASGELVEKIQHAVDLMRHRNPSGDLEVMFERAVDLLIATLERERLGKTARPRKATEPGKPGYVTKATARKVVARDGHQCAYVAPDGRRCTATGFLEFDHVDARGKGGGDEAENIRMFCFAHNKHAAEQAYGREHVEMKIQLRRRKPEADAPAAIA